MTSPPRKLALAVAAAGAPSPEHKRFQTLLGKIDRARARLAAWQRELPAFAEAHAARIEPLRRDVDTLRREWAFDLEQLLHAQRWAKVDAAMITELLLQTCGDLLGDADTPDAELLALHDRHAPVPYDAAEQQEAEVMKSLFERMSGLDLGDAPVESIDELMQRAQARMDEQSARQPPRRARKPKKPTEAEQRITQTVREVYRKLASALHPDRMPADATAEERAAANARMQRANAAYEAGDLLTLLELQLQIEQVDATHVASIDAAQVRHFNKLLAEQLRELEQDIQEREIALCSGFGLRPSRRPDPDKLGLVLQEAQHELQAERAQILHDRRTLNGDMATARRFLKDLRAEQRLRERLGAFGFG